MIYHILDKWGEEVIKKQDGKVILYVDIAELIAKYLLFFNHFELKNCTIGVKTKNIENLLALYIACELCNINLLIIPDKLENSYYQIALSKLKVDVMIIDDMSDMSKNYATNNVYLWLSTDLNLIHSNKQFSDNNKISQLLLSFKKSIFEVNDNLKSVLKSYVEELYLTIPRANTARVIFFTPGVEIQKIIGFSYKDINDKISLLNKELNKNNNLITSLITEEIQSYTFITSILFPISTGGNIIISKNDGREILNTILKNKIDLYLVDSLTFVNIIKLLTSDSKLFRNFKLWLNFLKYRKNLKEVIIFGKLYKPDIRLLNCSGIKFKYSYVLAEVGTMVSYKNYNKLPKKRISTGYPILPVKFNAKHSRAGGEIEISSKEYPRLLIQADGYSITSQSSVNVGYSRTGDYGLMYKGELIIIDRILQMFVNEKGLVIQKGVINNHLRDLEFILDMLIIINDNKIIVFIQLNNSYMKINNIELHIAKEILKDELKKLNKKLPVYSTVEKLVITANEFVKVNNKNLEIKTL